MSETVKKLFKLSGATSWKMQEVPHFNSWKEIFWIEGVEPERQAVLKELVHAACAPHATEFYFDDPAATL